VNERLSVGCDEVAEIVEGDERGLDMVGQARIAGHPVGGLVVGGQCCRWLAFRREGRQHKTYS
jgi:hypothetical protein